MARYNPIKNSFVAGELSPRLEGRDDIDQYFQGLRQSRNGVVLPHGGFMRRSGSRFVAEVKDSSKQVRLIPFQAGTAANYVVEFGNGYARFYLNEGRLESGGSPVEVSPPYDETEVMALQHTQNADVMYVVHSDHPPYTLSRTSATSFSFSKVTFKNGRAPLRPENLDTTLTVTVTGTGPYTLTWNNDPVTDGLTTAFDVGRMVRINDGTNEGWLLITSVSASDTASATLEGGSAPTGGATDDWALGLFSDAEGPRAVAFHEGRLWYGGAPTVPDWFVGSVSDDFNNFELRDPTVTDAENADKAIAKRLVSRQVNAIYWMASADEQLAIGTSGAEFRVFATGTDEVLTPTDTLQKATTSRGSKQMQAAVIDAEVLFVQKNGRKIRRYSQGTTNAVTLTYRSQDITILAEHILDSGEGATQLGYQQDPDSVLWIVRNDGRLIGITYEIDQKVVGAHTHVFGDEDLDSVESIAIIVDPSQTQDQLWLAVNRTVNGATKRYVEYVEDQFRPAIDRRSTEQERIDALEDAFFVDSGLSLDSPVTITDITNANPAVVTAASHGFSDGDRVKLRDIVGIEDSDGDSLVNRFSFKVANKTTNTFELTDLDGNNVDTSSATAYDSGGTARKEVNSVSGLSHLEGRTCQVLIDGAPHPDVTVSSGSVTLDRFGSIIHVGIGFSFFGETMPFVGGGRIGTDQGKKQKIKRVTLRLYNTLGGSVQTGSGLIYNGEDLIFRSNSPMDQPPPLFTGDKEVPVENSWEDDPTVYFENMQPLPMTVLAIMPQNETNER